MTRNPTPGSPLRTLCDMSLERFAASSRADFRFAPLNAFLMVAIFAVGLGVHLFLYPFTVQAVGLALGSALVMAVLVRLSQVWEVLCAL